MSLLRLSHLGRSHKSVIKSGLRCVAPCVTYDVCRHFVRVCCFSHASTTVLLLNGDSEPTVKRPKMDNDSVTVKTEKENYPSASADSKGFTSDNTDSMSPPLSGPMSVHVVEQAVAKLNQQQTGWQTFFQLTSLTIN